MRWSTLTLLLALGTPLMFTACATMGPPQPPSLELPKPPADLRAVRKGDRVILSWTAPSITTDRKNVRGLGATRICRGLDAKLTQCGVPVGEAAAQASAPRAGSAQQGSTQPGSTQAVPTAAKSSKQKISVSYTDTLPAELESDNPSRLITYAVEVLNGAGRGAGLSNQVRVSLVRTLPPPRDFGARVTGQGVVLSWTGDVAAAGSTKPSSSSLSSSLSLRYVYRVYRRPEASREWSLAGEVPAGTEARLALVDSNIEWEKTYEYRAEMVTVVRQENKPDVLVEGDDTPEVTVFADDVFPPAVPGGLQAVFSGPGQKSFIDLVWAPVADVDLDGYNVYRHEAGTVAVKVNAELVKTPAFRDVNVVAGKDYFYSVSAVDVRGNESARSEEAGESVP
jgi:hypothetical protein